jgi:N-methylhydantoinase A
LRGFRSACFDGAFGDTPVYNRAGLLCGNRIQGPALIEEHASTSVLWPGDSCEIDALGNLAISVGDAS